MYTYFKTDSKPGFVELNLKTNNGKRELEIFFIINLFIFSLETIIKTVIIFAEGIFKGECHVS
jgi:hypothetical protein